MMWPAGLRAVAAVTVLFGFTVSTPVWVDREAVVMGTRLKVEIEAPTAEEADAVIDRVFETVVAFDRSWAAGSASGLADMRSAELGDRVRLDDATFDLLSRAWDLADRTDGAFEPAAGPLIDAWNRTNGGQPPGESDLERALASVGRRCFDLSAASRTLSRHCPGAWIDGSGFGEGAALAVIAGVLEQEGVVHARVRFGRQWLVLGRESAVGISIAHPRDSNAAAFELRDVVGALATRSSVVEPSLDPRSGLPVAAWGGVAVRSDDPLEADALASALLVMGPTSAIRWLAARPDVEALIFVEDERGVVACGSEVLLQSLTPVTDVARIAGTPRLTEALRPCD